MTIHWTGLCADAAQHSDALNSHRKPWPRPACHHSGPGPRLVRRSSWTAARSRGRSANRAGPGASCASGAGRRTSRRRRGTAPAAVLRARLLGLGPRTVVAVLVRSEAWCCPWLPTPAVALKRERRGCIPRYTRPLLAYPAPPVAELVTAWGGAVPDLPPMLRTARPGASRRSVACPGRRSAHL